MMNLSLKSFVSQLQKRLAVHKRRQRQVQVAWIPCEVMEPRLLMAADVGATFAKAKALGDVGAKPVVLVESVGTKTDVDIYQFQVLSGQKIAFDIDTPTNGPNGLGSYLRIFDAAGNELAANNDRLAPGDPVPGKAPAGHVGLWEGFDSYIEHTFVTGGTYYVGVSNWQHRSYNPTTGATALTDDPNWLTGKYSLTISGNTLPEGILDGVNSHGVAQGWAVDRDVNGASIRLHIYIDGKHVGTTSTDVARPDVERHTGIPGNHGFRWAIPNEFRDNKPHTLAVFALDPQKVANPKLIGSDITFNLAPVSPPQGSFDGINADGIVFGWALDRDDPSLQVRVDVWIDGKYVGTAPTDQVRNDVINVTGVPGEHGFRFQIPAKFRDGKKHTVEVFAIDPQGIQNATLINSPKAYQATRSPGIQVTPTTGLTTNEAGSTASFTVVLQDQPAHDVIIPVSSSDTTEGQPNVSQLVFTPANWNQPQTVTVTGADDTLDDGDVEYRILLGAAVSNDTLYQGKDATDPRLGNLDDDDASSTPPPVAPSIIVTPTSGLVTTEQGGKTTFTVVLSQRPTANVVIPVSSLDLTEGNVNKKSLTFTKSNWNKPQKVTVTGVDDRIHDRIVDAGEEGAEGAFYTVTLAAARSKDARYNGLDADDVQLVNLDDEEYIKFVANYVDDPGEGFYDPVLGEDRQQAFEAAMLFWSDYFAASYESETITIDAQMNPIPSDNPDFITLASARPTDFALFGSGSRATVYGHALANHLAEEDLDPHQSEITIWFNTNAEWYYGFDGEAGALVDFISTAMHEIGHGLDIFSNLQAEGNYFVAPSAWDRFLENGDGKNLTKMTQSERAAALIGNDLFWEGTFGTAHNAGLRPRIHAPAEFDGGSSTGHLDETVHKFEMMSPVSSGADHEPSRMELGMLADMGWTIGAGLGDDA